MKSVLQVDFCTLGFGVLALGTFVLAVASGLVATVYWLGAVLFIALMGTITLANTLGWRNVLHTQKGKAFIGDQERKSVNGLSISEVFGQREEDYEIRPDWFEGDEWPKMPAVVTMLYTMLSSLAHALEQQHGSYGFMRDPHYATVLEDMYNEIDQLPVSAHPSHDGNRRYDGRFLKYLERSSGGGGGT